VKKQNYPTYRKAGVEWLHEVPAHWDVKRLKTVASYWVSNVDKVPSEDESPVRLCNYTDVYYNDFIRPDMELLETTATSEEIRRFGLQDGDVLITKDSESWNDIAVPALVVATSQDLLCGYHLALVRPRPRHLLGAFLLRIFQSRAVNQQFQLAATGVTRYGLPKSAIGDALLPLPPTDEQRCIADFLDAKTTKIDTLVLKKRTLIEKLKEKRTALISRTVACGLPPHAARAVGLDAHPKLKSSGIEWLGNVPEHWRVTRLKYAAKRIVDCPHETPTYSSDGDFSVVRTADLSSGVLDLSRAYQVDEEEYRRRIRREPVLDGDIVYGREGERWGFGALIPPGPTVCLGQRMMQLRAADHFNPRFLMWQLNSSSVYKQGAIDTAGATSPHVNVETIRNYWLSEPPLAEQSAIANYLDRETAKIDQMVAKAEAAIERLREYRSALITAAVTGKIDVREPALVSTNA
jgi:type I restriction enzyme, S subunit